MKITLISTVVLGLAVSLWAQDSVPTAPTVPQESAGSAAQSNESDAVRIQALTSAYTASYNEFTKKVRKERDDDARAQLYKERPSAYKIISEILTIAKKNPKADGVGDGLVWSVSYASSTQTKEIESILLTHYKDSEILGRLAYKYSKMYRGGEGGLRKIIEVSTDDKVKQGALYYLASKLIKNEATKNEGFAMMKKLQNWPNIENDNPHLLTQVKEKVFFIENLSIGCTPPDIEGVDHEGKSFKLSDYKGQVVLLDFWGFW